MTRVIRSHKTRKGCLTRVNTVSIPPLPSVRRFYQPLSISSFSRTREEQGHRSSMADRFFQNEMPDFVAENPNLMEEEARQNQGRVQLHPQATQDSLLRFLSLPHSSLSQQLQRAALDLKETVTFYFLSTRIFRFVFVLIRISEI